MKRLVQEGVLVAVIGAALAFAANALSPHRLDLRKDYFPGSTVKATAPAANTNAPSAAGAKTNSPSELLAARLRAHGLQLADSNQVIQFFRDPSREQGGIAFIDARNDDHYRAGHIPGAYLFDRFQQDTYIASVVQVCVTAQQIIFYCNGGDCEDSEHAAIMLRDSIHIPNEKVFVYGGGIAEWATNGLPIEIGERNSGQLTNVVKTAAAANAGQQSPPPSLGAKPEERKQ